MHVLPSSKQVGENREHVRDVVDGDGSAQKGVESSRGAEVQASQRGNDSRDHKLRIERNLQG